MGIIKFLEGINKRLLLTNREFGSISEKKPSAGTIQDNLARSIQKFNNMIFNDFFQLDTYSDEQYRELFSSISNTLKENEILTTPQFLHLKRFNDFSRAMHKNLRTYLKENLKDLIKEEQEPEVEF